MDEEKENFLSSTKFIWLIVSGVLIIAIGTAATTISTVTELGPQIDRLQRDVDQHDQWIAEWPSTGELSSDVRQNERILQLAEELEETDEKIDEILDRLRDIEIQGVGN